MITRGYTYTFGCGECLRLNLRFWSSHICHSAHNGGGRVTLILENGMLDHTWIWSEVTPGSSLSNYSWWDLESVLDTGNWTQLAMCKTNVLPAVLSLQPLGHTLFYCCVCWSSYALVAVLECSWFHCYWNLLVVPWITNSRAARLILTYSGELEGEKWEKAKLTPHAWSQ